MAKGKQPGKRKPVPRAGLERPYNNGTWTSARFHSFIVSALRSASVRWGPKYECLRKAFVRRGINPATGRMCKLHRCASCGGLFPQSALRADHIEPVVHPERGFEGWDVYVSRMFCEADGFAALCEPCHAAKTAAERAMRAGKLARKTAPRPRSSKKSSA